MICLDFKLVHTEDAINRKFRIKYALFSQPDLIGDLSALSIHYT